MIQLMEEQHDLPIVTVEVVVRNGHASDPIGREGLARHAAELMRRGAGSRDRHALDDALDALGASIDVEVEPDATSFVARCLRRNLEPTVALLADVLARPRLESDEHERLRRESLALLDEVRDDDASLCGRWFERDAYGAHPYGRSALGTVASLTALQVGDAAAWAKRQLVPDHMIVGFAGDIDQAAATTAAARLTEALPRTAAPVAKDPGDPSPGTARRAVIVDKPDRQQTQILIGHGTPRHSAPDWLPLQVGAAAFGGMFTSRLMTEVRVKRGWSYGASARVGRGRYGSSFRIRVFPAMDQAANTLGLVLELWERIVAEGLRPDELDLARGYLAGSWAFEVDTPPRRLDRRIDAIVMDIDPDLYTRYAERVGDVTLDQVNDTIRRHWFPERALTVVTATADDLRPALKDLRLGDIAVESYDTY